jgi:hypothetical protein
VYLHAVYKVEIEMHAAIRVAERAVNNAIANVNEGVDPSRRQRVLVAGLTRLGNVTLARSKLLVPRHCAPRRVPWQFDRSPAGHS